MIVALLALLPQLRAVGLEADERLIALAPAPAELTASGTARGRVVDAFDAAPVGGATVETWTEEIDAWSRGFARLGETRTGVDGQFEVARGPKARVLAPGYLTLSTTGSDLDGVVLLFPASVEPPRVRVLDSRDRPITGARFTTTFSCPHDLPAFDVLTDARGIATLPGFGLQEDVPELRVQAPGYAALKYLDGRSVLDGATDPFTVHLPRRRPVAVRLLDLDGAPLADEAILVTDDEGYHVVRTDEQGGLRIASRYGNDGLHLRILGETYEPFVFELRPPAPATVSLRRSAEHWPEDTPEGRVRIEWGGDPAPDGRIAVQLFHEDGWAVATDADSGSTHAFPAGRGWLHAGGAFRGHREEWIPFELRPGAQVSLRADLEPEPRVSVRIPEGDGWSLWVEAGEETLEIAPSGEPIAVPAERPLCFFLHGGGAPRRAWVASAVDGMVIDLAADETRIAPDPPPRPRTHADVIVEDELACTAEHLNLRATNGECELAKLDDPPVRRYRVEGPAGTTFLVAHRRDGCAETWIRGTLPPTGAPAPRFHLAVVELAALELEADFPFSILGFADEPSTKHAIELHPGLLDLVIEEPDGRRHGLSLVLKPAASRAIRLVRDGR